MNNHLLVFVFMVWYMWCSICLWNWHSLLCSHIWNSKGLFILSTIAFYVEIWERLSHWIWISSIQQAEHLMISINLPVPTHTPVFPGMHHHIMFPMGAVDPKRQKLSSLYRVSTLLTKLGLGSTHSLSNSLENCGTDILIHLP